MDLANSTDERVQGAQDALDALFAARLSIRDASERPVFQLKEVASDDRPVLIQCCIR